MCDCSDHCVRSPIWRGVRGDLGINCNVINPVYSAECMSRSIDLTSLQKVRGLPALNKEQLPRRGAAFARTKRPMRQHLPTLRPSGRYLGVGNCTVYDNNVYGPSPRSSEGLAHDARPVRTSYCRSLYAAVSMSIARFSSNKTATRLP